MAILTNRSHVVRALDFYAKTDIYFGIGQPTAWPDDNNPPAPDPTATDLNSLIGVRKPDNKFLVVPDPNGSISYHGSTWSQVSSDQALAQGAKWVYLDTTIQASDLPLGWYRQVGVYSGLTLFTGTKEVDTLGLTAGATTSGNIQITLNGQYVTIAVTAGMTASQIADKIRNTPIIGWTVGGTMGTANVTFTNSTVGACTSPAYSAGGTGATGVISATTLGANATPPNAVAMVPSQIGSTGRLELLDNRTPAQRIANQQEKLTIIMQF